jgi:hypothetical protein
MNNNDNEIKQKETKICSKCKQEKTLNNYVKDKNSKDGLKYKCKECSKEYSFIYNKINSQKRKEVSKKWKENNKEKTKIQTLLYQRKNKERLYKLSTKYHKNRYNNDPHFKLRKLLRDRIFKTITRKKVTSKTKKLLGCTFEEFKQHLELQFKPEMNWENHGEIWEIDHIKPCTSFNLLVEKEQQICFHYTNFQPLFKTTEIAESFGYKDEIGNRNKLNKY